MGLSHSEAEWVDARRKVVLHAMEGYLGRLNMTDFNMTEYVARIQMSNLTKTLMLGFAVSGGDYVSAYTGAGSMRSLDSRLPAANAQRTGGLLQNLTYVSGQSGGSWPITTLSTHNFPTIDVLIKLWCPNVDFLDPANGTQNVPTPTSLMSDLLAKKRAPFKVSELDWLGRADGYEFLPGPYQGVSITFSGIVNLSSFKNH